MKQKKQKRQTFTVIVPVTQASGTRTYFVEAASPEEAKAMVNTGDIEPEGEELDVEHIAPPEDWDMFDASGKRVKSTDRESNHGG